MNPLERALKNPRSKAAAIRAKCWDCEGAGADPAWVDRVRHCVVDSCPLWHVRPYRSVKADAKARYLREDPKMAVSGGGGS